MAIIDQTQTGNYLLRTLPTQTFARFAPHLRFVELPLRQVLVEPEAPIRHVCFLESGLGSVVASSGDETLEVSHVGREGMTGWHVLHKTDRTANKTFMQIAGSGFAISVEKFEEALDDDLAGRDLLLRYVQACETQVAQAALTNGRYNIHRRLARWLLMCHDRLGENDLPLTHEFLALMLGVRRSGVTDELHAIEGLEAIKASRGMIRVTDRLKLEQVAGGCYGVAEREYERLVGTRLSAASQKA